MRKNFANSRPSASNFKNFSRSLEQFFLTVGQNNFGNKIPIFPFECFSKSSNSGSSGFGCYTKETATKTTQLTQTTSSTLNFTKKKEHKKSKLKSTLTATVPGKKIITNKAELLLLKLTHLFAREVLLVKKLKIEETKTNF